MTTSHPVEIKVTLGGDAASTVAQLGLDAGEPVQVWFLEDLTVGLREPMPLLTAGIVLRVRARGDQDDSTVKLRPARLSQLLGQWSSDDKDGKWRHRIESDWAGDNRCLAVSSVLGLPAGAAATAVAGDVDLGSVFGERQKDFLRECADLPVNPSGLTALGPIAATKWEDVPLAGVADVNAERWTIGPMDFLELSIRVDPDDGVDPVGAQADFEAAVRAGGFVIPDQQVPKTKQVMAYLAGTLG